MKIRVMGTLEECTAFKNLFLEHVNKDNGYSVSDFYQNRGNSNLYRCYIEFDPVTVNTQKKITSKR